jgi:threonine dehydrogenase-like Zn-dependent dehydrogenase
MHKVSPDLAPRLAALYQPIAAGIRWAAHEAGTKIGDVVAIFGAGQRGLGAVIAAREAGAAAVIVTGLARDAHKLDLALEYGATATIIADEEDTVARLNDLTGGEGADIVLDLTPAATEPVVHAVKAAKPRGTILFAGIKGGGQTIENFSTDEVIMKELTLKGMNGQDLVAYEPALKLIESRRYPLEKMITHAFPLDQAEEAILTLAGRVENEQPVCVTIVP